jgi:UDP-glucose 4-epimerase
MLTHHNNPPAAPARVLVIGANGFLSRDLADYLTGLGVPFRCVGSSEANLFLPESVDVLQGIIRPDDAVVMMSALTPEKGRDVKTLMKNLAMAGHLCAALERQRCAHLIYVSSDSVYDTASALVHEGTPCTGPDLYGQMHLTREKMFQFTAASLKIPCCVVRPCAVYGAGDTHNSYGPNRFMRTALKEGKIALFGHGEEHRDHIYVRDVSRFLWQLLLRRTAGVIGIVTGRAVSFQYLARQIMSLCPHPVRLESLPRSGPITHRHFDISLRLREFPEFHTTPLEEGLRMAWEGMSANSHRKL